MRRLALPLALAAALLAARPAQAVRLPAGAKAQAQRDARRFGPRQPAARRTPTTRVRHAFGAFNRGHGGGWRLRFNERTGAPAALIEGRSAPRRGAAEAVSSAFLGETREVTQIDPASLALERRSQGNGLTHLLYRQTYRGLPVEFARVKVHVDEKGAVLGVNSSYEADLGLDTTPALSAAQAAEAVRRDNGRPPADGGALVVLADLGSGRGPRLAWKFTAPGALAVWRYYVDAGTGEILLRYNDLRFQAACLTSGTISGMIYPVSPSESAAAQTAFNSENVFVGDGSTWAVTGWGPVAGPGFFCHAQAGKIIASLQGPWVNVSNFRGPSAHYDNGGGTWSTLSTSLSSPHPYPANSVLISTLDITASAPDAVKFLPVFSNFHVGDVTTADGYFASISDDDQVTVLDSSWNAVAGYFGDRGAFNAAAVHGQKLFLRLRSNAQHDGQYGYDVSISSYLVLANSPHTPNPSGSDLVWRPQNTALGLRGEISLFYHLNRMHDYFMSDVNKSSAAWLGKPVNALAFVGPGLDGAFYNPTADNLSFGDGGDANNPTDLLTDDATVPGHEYTHYMVEKIWPIINFGQSGAISEAMADYFSGSSLNRSGIGKHYNGGKALRELDCPTQTPCAKLTASNWQSDLYGDSLFLSQALWDIRKARIAAQGSDAGRSCADGLAFQSLLFFPESFQEFRDALLRVDADGRVAACGGAGTAADTIRLACETHGITDKGGDALEGTARDDGFETSVDVSTRHSIGATIYPAGDMDYYTFGAGAGPMRFALSLPPDGYYYKGYMLTLYDRNHAEAARAEPPYNGFNTQDGLCNTDDCTTTDERVVLTYVNSAPGQFFLQVAGGTSVNGSNSGVNSAVPYALELVYPESNVFPGAIVSAAFDRDQIGFDVTVTSFPRTVGPGGPGGQDYSFAYAQLRDHALSVLPLTDTRLAGSGYLTVVSSANSGGLISGRISLQPGFAARYPAVGSVHLEVFGYNVRGSTVSLGLSQPLYLSTTRAELTAYNNIFNPARGEKATIKYETLAAGRVTLKLFTLSGALAATLIDEERPAGKGSVDWTGINLNGNTVASGIYLLRLSAPGISKTQKIAIVK